MEEGLLVKKRSAAPPRTGTGRKKKRKWVGVGRRLTTLLLLCLEKTKVKTALAWQGACYIGFALRKRGRAALLLSPPVSGGGGFVMGPHKRGRGRGKYTGKCMRQIKIRVGGKAR